MFTEAEEVRAFSAAVREVFDETFEHLEEAKIGYLFTGQEIVMKGSRKAAYAIIPTAMGQNRKLFDWALERAFGFYPEAIIVVDSEIWEEMTPEQRVALVYHEARHIGHAHTKAGEPRYTEEGLPVLEIAPHDVEEFLDVADTFGAWHEGLETFGRALQGKAETGRIKEVLKLVKKAKP